MSEGGAKLAGDAIAGVTADDHVLLARFRCRSWSWFGRLRSWLGGRTDAFALAVASRTVGRAGRAAVVNAPLVSDSWEDGFASGGVSGGRTKESDGE